MDRLREVRDTLLLNTFKHQALLQKILKFSSSESACQFHFLENIVRLLLFVIIQYPQVQTVG
jgi:hypothetical protein